LAAERLQHHGYINIENLNLRRHNYPFGDLLATKSGTRYFIGVKARNEMRQGNVGLNESYNLVLIPDALNRRLKEQGKTTDQITAMLLAEVSKLATDLSATPGLLLRIYLKPATKGGRVARKYFTSYGADGKPFNLLPHAQKALDRSDASLQHPNHAPELSGSSPTRARCSTS
jgi:hypothetical protein